MVEKLKRTAYAIVLVCMCLGFAAVVALALTPHLIIGEGRFGAFIHRLESFDFKWWVTGIAFGLWSFLILLLITYQRAKGIGQELRRFQGGLRSLLAHRAIPVIVDIDQKVPIELDQPLDVPIELHTTVNLDSDVELDADVPIRTELPIETKVQTQVLGIGTISIPIRARVPIDVVVPVKGHTRIKVTDLPIDLTHVGVGRLSAIEIPVRARIQARIDLLSNLESAESFLARTDKNLPSTIQHGLARLWHTLFK
jgi:hypothetical protein